MKKGNPTTVAVEKVMKEFNSLGGARQNLTTQDIAELRKHAKLRTDLSLPEDELSEEQKVWKILYNTLDQQLGKMLGADEKAKIDSLFQDIDNLTTVQKALELKMKRQGNKKDHGQLIFYTFLLVGFFLSWVLSGSFLWAVVIGLFSAFVGLLIGVTILESGDSQLRLGRYLDKLANLTGSKTLKKSASNLFSKGIGLDELEKVDNDPSRIVDLHKKLNELFDKQSTYMSLPHSEDVEYRKNSDALHEEMLNPDKTIEEHIKTANVIINLANKITELSIDPLRKVNDEIQQTLVELDKEIKKVKSEQKKTKLVKWFDATNDYYLNRKILSNYTISSVEWDRKIPESVIKNNGDITVKMSSDITVEMAKSTAQVKEAGDKGEKLNETRKNLAKEIFGILE